MDELRSERGYTMTERTTMAVLTAMIIALSVLVTMQGVEIAHLRGDLNVTNLVVDHNADKLTRLQKQFRDYEHREGEAALRSGARVTGM